MKEKITRNEFFKRSALFTAGVGAAAVGLSFIPDSQKQDLGLKQPGPTLIRLSIRKLYELKLTINSGMVTHVVPVHSTQLSANCRIHR